MKMKAFFSQQFVSKWKWSWWEHKAICSREEEGKNGHDALFQLSNEDDEKLGDTKWAGTHLSSKSTTPTRKVMKTNLFLLPLPLPSFQSVFIYSVKKKRFSKHEAYCQKCILISNWIYHNSQEIMKTSQNQENQVC